MTSIDDLSARTDFAGIQALSSRGPGYAVAQKCLEVQAEAEAKDPSLNSTTGVKLHPDAWSWYTGAVGEMEVGRLLSALSPEWFVRHSVPIGAGTKDVDHLVVGPGGVFAINTKHHNGASVWVGDHVLRVNNANTPHLNIAQGDGIDVARRLESKVGFPVAVTSVVAVLNARSLSDGRAPENRRVQVVDARNLVGWLVSRPRRLDEATLGLIKLAAEEPETWHIDPRAADTLRVMQRFERLVAEVGTQPAPIKTQQRPQAPRNRPGPTGHSHPTRRGSRGRSVQQASIADLLKLWVATAVIIIALFVIRAYADEPCSSAITCVAPTLYLAVKPLLVLGGVAVIAGGSIGTLVMGLRIVRR